MKATEAAGIEVRGVAFAYRGRPALEGVDLAVGAGEIFGLLGPNGGGKTTLLRILATLLPVQTGEARVGGFDLARQAGEVRRLLGVVFQSPAVDPHLSVTENLRVHGRLYGMTAAELAPRIATALARFGLADRARERVATLSGGLVRRLELAKALLPRPRLLLLDEPSTGLDPGARRDLWRTLASVREQGVTLLVTTHLLDEAERCDRLALLDGGRVVALGTPAALKGEIGGDVLTLATGDPEGLAEALAAAFGTEATPVVTGDAVRLEHPQAQRLALRVAEALPAWLPRIDAWTVSRPTLEDVFLKRTGHGLSGREGA